VDSPPLVTSAATRSPFPVSTRCRSPGSIPADRAKPVAAGVGLPSASKAARTAGPRRVPVRRGRVRGTAGIRTASRRGVAKVSTVSASISSPRSVRYDVRRAASCSSAGGM